MNENLNLKGKISILPSWIFSGMVCVRDGMNRIEYLLLCKTNIHIALLISASLILEPPILAPHRQSDARQDLGLALYHLSCKTVADIQFSFITFSFRFAYRKLQMLHCEPNSHVVSI